MGFSVFSWVEVRAKFGLQNSMGPHVVSADGPSPSNTLFKARLLISSLDQQGVLTCPTHITEKSLLWQVNAFQHQEHFAIWTQLKHERSISDPNCMTSA